MSMASKKTDSATNPKMTSPSPRQQQSQSQQRYGHAGHSLASGWTEEASDRAFQNVDDPCGFDSPGMDGECGLRAIEGQRDEDTMPSLDLYMESLEVDARVGGVYVPPSPWHSGTDNSMDIMYDGLEETALFPPSAPVASTPPRASTAAVSSAAFLPTQVSGKEAAARDSMSSGESLTSSSPSSAMLAPPLPPASHSAAEPRSARTQQSGSRSHSAEKSGRSGQSQGSEVRSSGEGSKGVESVEYQQLQEKYRVLRKNMVALCRSSQSEMQSKLRTIAELRAALKEKESRCVAEGGGTLQSDTCQDQSAGPNAFLNGNFSLPALSSSQRPEGSRLPQSQSAITASGGSSKTTETLAGIDGAPPSVSERVSAKPKMYSSVSVQTCVPEKQAQTEALRTSNKRIQTSSRKLVRRHTQTDLLKPVHASVQTDMLVNLERLMTASLRLVDKPVQTDSASHLTVDKPAQTCTQRLVSKSVETDFDIVVDEPVLRDSVRRGSVNEVHYVDCVMDMDAEKPLHGHSPDHTEDRSPTAVREVACIRAELKERDEAVQSRGAECAHRSPTDQAGPGKVTQYTCSSTASRKRLCDPFSEPEFGERKRVRRRLSSDERQTEYLSDADHDSVFDPRTDGLSHGGNVSVDVKSHCDPCSPAHSGEFHTVYDEHVDTVSILDTGNDAMDLSMSGSASGVIVSEQERTSGRCFLSTAHPSTKQETPAPARASKMHSPEDTDKEQCTTQGDKDTVPPRAGQGARVIPSGKQPLTRPATLGCLQDIKGQAWKRMLLLWSCFAHKTVSRREEIDAVFFGKENPKVYDWSRLELEQDPTNRDPTQISPHKHDSSHLTHPHEATTDKLKFGKSLEKENDLAQHQHAAVELPDAEGCSVTFEGSSPNIGEAETDNPNLTSSVSTSSATGSVPKQKKKKKDKKKDRHSTEKVDEKREKKRKKRKKKDDSSMKDQESVGVRKESEVDWKPPEGNDTTSKWKTVGEVNRTASVKDADGFTEAHEEAEGNDCSTYIKANVLPSAEIQEDADCELTAGPETMSEVLKSTPGPYSCGTDGEKSALCLGQKDQTLIDKRTVSANQKGREVVDNVTVNTRQEDGEIDGIRKTSQENKAVSSDEIGTSPEGQSAHDTSDETVSDFSIHTDDSDSEGCPVKKMTENKPKIGCVSKDEDETVDDAAHDVDLIKDDILEDGADTHAGACVDDLVGPVEEDNMSEASDESADVNEGDMPDDHRTLCRQPTFKSNSTNSLEDGIEPMPEDDLAQDWLSSAHECASRGIVADINESTHSIDCTVEECEDSSRQQQDETAHMSVADRNSPWSQLHSAGVGKADSGTEGTQAFSPSLFSKEVTSEGGDLRTTGKDMSPEERNSTSVDLSNMPTTPVRSRHPPVTPKKNWLLRTAVAVGEGEESTLFGSAMRTAATRDLFDPSLIWSPEKTSHNTLSLREPISIDSFNNMLGMASNSTSSEESLARSVPFTDPQSGGMAARSQRSGKTVWTSSERLKADVKCPSGLQQAQKDIVLEVAKPCQPVQSNQQTSDRQTAVDQGQEERRLDMEGGVEAEETRTHALQQPVEMDDKTPLFGYPSTVGLRDSATHCFHYKRRLPHLPPSSSSSASSTTASRSSSLTSASLSSLSTEPPPASLQPSLTSRLSQKLETVEEDRLDEERGNVEEDYTSNSVEQSSSGLALLPKDTLPSRKEGALLASRQASEEMAHIESEEQLPSTRSSEQKNCAKDVREHVFDDSLKETSDSTCVDMQGENGIPRDSDYHDAVSHSRTASQLCTGIAQSAQSFSPLSPLSEQRSGQSQVNLPEDADSLTSCVTEVGTSASAVRLQRKELEDGEIDSRDSLCQTPSYTQVGNTADNFTPTLMDITEQSLEEGEIRSGDESDTSEDQNPPGDEVIISVQSGDDIDVQSGDDINEDTFFEDMRDQLTHKGKRPRSPNTSKRMAPTLKKLKSGTERDPSHVESHGQAHNPKAAVPKSKRGEEKRKALRREESEAGLCEDKENGKLDKQAQERRQRNRERLDKVRLQIVGHKQPRNKHSGLKSFTIPKVNRSSGSAQVQKDQNLSSENAHKASVHFAFREKEGDGVQDSTQCSRRGGKTETRREKEGRVRQEMDSSRERRLSDERDGKQRKYSEGRDGEHRKYIEGRDGEHRKYSKERDGEHRKYSEGRDGEHKKYSEERDGKQRKYSEERDGEHGRCSEERDGKHRKYSEERDGKHRKYSEERDGKHRKYSEERDGKYRKYSEERDGKYRKYSEERDGKHRKYSEEREGKHRRLSEERDGKHRRLSEERDGKHRRLSKEKDITHRRPSKESSITHRRRSEEREGKYREHSEERNVPHRRHSKERDTTHRRHSEEGDSWHGRHSEEERDIGHRRHSEEERDIGHRRHSEEGDNRHRRYGSEGDRDRRGSEERNGGHRRHSEERDRHRRHSKERDGRHRRHSNEGDSRRDSEERSGRTRRLSEEDRRHSRVKKDRDRRENKAGESRDRLPSKDGGDDRGYSREEGGRDRRSEKEQSSKYVKERDNKDDKTTEHGKQRDSQRATFRQERDDRSATRHSANSADTGGKRSRADNQPVAARPHLSSPSSGGADVRCDNTESPSPSITSETGHFTSQRVDNSLRLRLSADRQNVPSNSGEAVQNPSESSAGRRQLPNQSSVKDKRSGNERSVQDEESFNDRLSENRPPPQGELIPAESPDSDPRVTEQQSSEQGLENDEHLSDPSQSEEETDSDGSFSVSDTDSESSDSLSRLAIEGSMRTRGFIYDRDPFKPRPEVEMSFEDEEEEKLEEQGNSGTKEEQTGSKSEDSEQEDDEDSCDEEDSGEENMSDDDDDDYDDDDDDNDAGQSKPNEAADTDTDDNEGDRGRPKRHDGKNRNKNTGPAQGEDPSCHDSDVEVFESESSDISQSTGDCMELCTGTSMQSVEITSGFHVLGHGQKLMAEELGDVNEKTGHCTERHSSGKGRVGERLGHCEERHSSGKGKVLERLDSPGGKHHPVQPHSPVGQQGSSDCLSLHPWDEAENFLLGDLSHPQDDTLQPAADGPRAAGRRRNPNSSECSITGKKSCQSTAVHRGSFPGVGHNQVNKKLPAESQTAENSSQRRDRTWHHQIVVSSGVGSSHYQTSEQGSKSKTLPLSKRHRQGESSPTLDKASRCKSSIPKHRSSSRSSSVDSSKESKRSDSSDRERDRRPCLSSASPCRTCEKHRRRTVDGVASTSGRRRRSSSSEASSPHRHEQRSRTVRSRQHWRDRKRSGEDRPHFPEGRHRQGAADRAKKCDLTRWARGHHSSREHRVRDSGQPHRYPGGTRRLCGREFRHCDCCSSGFKAKHMGDCCHRDVDDRGCSDLCRRTGCSQGQKCYNDRRKSRSPLKCCTRSRC